jgi:hypothetical protein
MDNRYLEDNSINILTMGNRRKPPKKRYFFQGILLIVILHCIQIGVYAALNIYGNTGFIPSSDIVKYAFGVIQMLYVIPALAVTKAKNKNYTSSGIKTAAIITVIANIVVVVLFFDLVKGLLY